MKDNERSRDRTDKRFSIYNGLVIIFSTIFDLSENGVQFNSAKIVTSQPDFGQEIVI